MPEWKPNFKNNSDTMWTFHALAGIFLALH